MTVVATLHDGGTVAKSSITQVVAAGVVYLTITFTDLRAINAIYDIRVTDTDPETQAYGIQLTHVTGNVVGFTIADVADGTTLSVEGVAEGH